MTGPSPGGSIRAALDGLDRRSITWCVWKGSDHLVESLAGDGDVDVLVDPGADHGEVEDALRAAGLVATRDRARLDRPVQDWLGLDGETGVLTHVQLYRALLIDDGLVDRWTLPVEEEVLSARVRGPDGWWVADPAHECVLLALQAAARPPTRLRRVLAQPAPRVQDLQARLMALRCGTSTEAVAQVAARWLGAEVGAPLSRLVSSGSGASEQHLEAFRVAAVRAAAPHRVHATKVAAHGHRVRVGRTKVRGRTRRDGTRRRSRVLAGPGLVVAVIGADGSGKSSLVTDLAAGCAAKLDTRRVYFGSGDGPSLAFFVPLKLARRVLWRFRPPAPVAGAGARPSTEVPDDADGLAPAPGPAKIIWALALALEKRRKARQSAAARREGAVVICDRYPQVQVPGIHDGPRLAPLARADRRWKRRLAAWELRSYRQALDTAPPDLVLRLRVSPDAAGMRRPDHDAVDLRHRIAVVRQLQLPGRTVEVDADRTFAHVVREVRTEVFASMRR